MSEKTPTPSSRPSKPRPTGAERRSAQIATLATRQAELKHEAAERRRARAERDASSPPKS